MDTATDEKVDTPESQDTPDQESAQSPVEDGQKTETLEATPQEQHEEMLKAAIEGSNAPVEETAETEEEQLIFGKYKSMEDAERAHNESVAEMNKARQEAQLLRQREVQQTTERLDNQTEVGAEDDDLKVLTEEMKMDADAAKKLLGIVDRRTNQRFKPIVKSIERAQTEARLIDLQEAHADLPKHMPMMVEIIKGYPEHVRKELNLEDVYYAAKARAPQESVKDNSQDTLKQVQAAQRTATTSSKNQAGVTSGGKRIWTREEIGRLTSAQYAKHEAEIVEQMSRGLIK